MNASEPTRRSHRDVENLLEPRDAQLEQGFAIRVARLS